VKTGRQHIVHTTGYIEAVIQNIGNCSLPLTTEMGDHLWVYNLGVYLIHSGHLGLAITMRAYVARHIEYWQWL